MKRWQPCDQHCDPRTCAYVWHDSPVILPSCSAIGAGPNIAAPMVATNNPPGIPPGHIPLSHNGEGKPATKSTKIDEDKKNNKFMGYFPAAFEGKICNKYQH